jgi:mono/diheme cytochrome c family protein
MAIPNDPAMLFWRMSAQSLLIQRAKNDVVPALKELVKKSEAASSHAFAVLASLRALDDASIATALRSSNRALRRIAIDHAGKSAPAVLLVSAKGPDLGTKSTRELAEKLVALSYGEPSEELAKSLYTMVTDASKEWFSDAVLTDAWQIAARRNAAAIIALADAREGKKPAKILPSNLIPNADFSESGSGIPKGWSLHMYGGDRSSVKMSMSDQGRNQSKALQITATESVDAGAGIELQLEPDTNYRFSAWVRTQNVKRTGGLGAMINVHGAQEKSKGMDGTKDWQLLSFDFKTDGDGRELLHCLLGGYGGSTGTAWFDDLSLTKLGGGGSPQSAVDGLRSWYASSKKPANLAEKKNKVDPEVVKRGAETYALICTACHQPDGQGTPGAFPPLDGSDWLVNDPELPIKIVLKGLQGPVTVKGVKYTSVMPPHNTLDDQKIADVLSYARHTWSNDAPAISADQVKATREKVKAQIQPWTAKDLGKE